MTDDSVRATAYLKAKLAVMKDAREVAKKRRHSSGFKYTGHDDVTEVLRDAFVEHGIIQSVSVAHAERNGATGAVEVVIEVTWTCVEDGSFEKVSSFGDSVAIKKRDGSLHQDDLQAGKAVSYAVKVAQLKNFMLLGGFPDNEERQERNAEDGGGTGGYQAPPKRDGGARPPKKDVSPEQVRLLVDQYRTLKTMDELDELRQAVGTLVASLDDASFKELESADTQAFERLK